MHAEVAAVSTNAGAPTYRDSKKAMGGDISSSVDEYLSVDERSELGRSRRSLLPRSALAELVGSRQRDKMEARNGSKERTDVS